MKTRQGFVSNSSSSSFILKGIEPGLSKEELMKKLSIGKIDTVYKDAIYGQYVTNTHSKQDLKELIECLLYGWDYDLNHSKHSSVIFFDEYENMRFMPCYEHCRKIEIPQFEKTFGVKIDIDRIKKFGKTYEEMQEDIDTFAQEIVDSIEGTFSIVAFEDDTDIGSDLEHKLLPKIKCAYQVSHH